jgi:hypothetical protein
MTDKYVHQKRLYGSQREPPPDKPSILSGVNSFNPFFDRDKLKLGGRNERSGFALADSFRIDEVLVGVNRCAHVR